MSLKGSEETDHAARVKALRARIDAALPALVEDRQPEALYAPVRYVLEGGGKRVRPTLLLLVAESFGADVEGALPAALAVEAFHNFTLVHDDIMDHSETRRGRPAVHVRWDTGTAVLAGDLLMALSYEQLTQATGAPAERLLNPYHRMAAKLCEGQALDKDFETRAGVSVEDYLRMIDGKTGALLAAAFEIGALLGGAGAAEAETLHAAGAHIGRAFQIRDDLLDLTADEARWGKTIGGDLVEGKKTLLLLRALERAEGDEHEWFARIVRKGGLPAGDVPEARRRMRRLGVLDEARAAVERHSRDALRALEALPDGPPARTVRWLTQQMQDRAS